MKSITKEVPTTIELMKEVLGTCDFKIECPHCHKTINMSYGGFLNNSRMATCYECNELLIVKVQPTITYNLSVELNKIKIIK